MTILSDEDIKKELGTNIYIYPYKADNLKGASYSVSRTHEVQNWLVLGIGD